jgi:hypothetical protein
MHRIGLQWPTCHRDIWHRTWPGPCNADRGTFARNTTGTVAALMEGRMWLAQTKMAGLTEHCRHRSHRSHQCSLALAGRDVSAGVASPDVREMAVHATHRAAAPSQPPPPLRSQRHRPASNTKTARDSTRPPHAQPPSAPAATRTWPLACGGAPSATRQTAPLGRQAAPPAERGQRPSGRRWQTA